MAGQDKPSLQPGFLGAQPRFSEIKMKTDSHRDAEFTIHGDNYAKIKMKTGTAIKVVTKLTECKADKELSDYVLVQREDDHGIDFRVAFPEDGWYKFQVFALPESDSNEQLPNVYNYIIKVERNHKATYPYVKTYTKFYKDCCYVKEPKFLNSATSDLSKVKFQVSVPGAEKVAVHCVEEWFHLAKKGGNRWAGEADLSRYRGKNSKVTVNANYDKDKNSYSVLLEYII